MSDAMPAHAVSDELPDLPEPVSSMVIAAWGPPPDYFTADQMHDYARAAIAAWNRRPAIPSREELREVAQSVVPNSDLADAIADAIYARTTSGDNRKNTSTNGETK